MIECTKAIDGLVSAAFGKNMVTISDLKKMMDRFALDPKVSEVAREAFIVSDVDLNRRMLKEFEKKAAAKHEEVVIIFKLLEHASVQVNITDNECFSGYF